MKKISTPSIEKASMNTYSMKTMLPTILLSKSSASKPSAISQKILKLNTDSFSKTLSMLFAIACASKDYSVPKKKGPVFKSSEK